MRFLLMILFFVSAGMFSQSIDKTKSRGDLYRKIAVKPYANLQTGYVVVTKSFYGLYFKDRYTNAITISIVEKFFKQRLKGYYKLKKYRLKIEKRSDGIYIDNFKLLI